MSTDAAEESIDCSQLVGNFYYDYYQDASLANGEHKNKNISTNGHHSGSADMDLSHGQGLDTYRIDNQQNHHHHRGEGEREQPLSFHMKVCVNEGPAAALMDRCLDYAATNSGGATR